MSKNRAEQTVARVREAYGKRDPVALAVIYAEDAVMVSSGEEPARGRKAIDRANAAYFSAFPDLTVDFLPVLAVGDLAFFEFRTKGTHNGVLATAQGDVQPTGRRVDFKGACCLRVNEKAEIVEDHTYYDTAEFARQLGAT
jgi:uncharacterized protein (TIGR02246 family)